MSPRRWRFSAKAANPKALVCPRPVRLVADSRAAIEVARSYLPVAKADTLARRAVEYYALWAFELADQQMKKGNLAAAMANLREGIRCSRSEEVTRKLCSLLSRAEQAQT